MEEMEINVAPHLASGRMPGAISFVSESQPLEHARPGLLAGPREKSHVWVGLSRALQPPYVAVVRAKAS